jgi:hypothetical protein
VLFLLIISQCYNEERECKTFCFSSTLSESVVFVSQVDYYCYIEDLV